MTRIPHTDSPTEVRQAFQQLTLQTDVITTGAVGYILVGGGIGVAPTWQIASAAIDHGAIGGLGDDDHAIYHTDARGDIRYFTKTEHLNTSAGAGDAGKPIKLDAAGHLDATMLNNGDVDHGAVGGLGDDDHTIYLLAGGTRALTGNLAVDALVTIDGRDISVDGIALDATVAMEGRVRVDAIATPRYLGVTSGDGCLRTGAGLSYTDTGNSVTLALSHLGIESLSDPGADRIMFWDDVGAAAVTWLTVSTGLQITTTNLTTKDSEIVHDNLSGYDANKHIDHTGVSISTGTGLSGGGTIASTRTLTLDINGLAADSIAAGDSLAFYDTTGGACDKITFANFEGTLAHNSLSGYVANEHIDWTNATDNITTTGTGEFAALGVGGLAAANTQLYTTTTYTLAAGSFYGINGGVYSDPAEVSTATFVGCQFTARVKSGNSYRHAGYGYGALITVVHQGTGQLDDAYAGDFRINNASTGIIASAYCFVGAVVNGGGGTINNAYGLYLHSLTAATTNWQIYSVAGNWRTGDDNSKLLLGTAQDASIYYNGTNLVIDPKEVGTGYVDIQGDITVDGTVAGTTITGANVTSGVDPGHTHGGASGGGWSPTAASVYLSADQSINHDTETVIQFDSELYDPGSNFNVGTYRYTVPSTGYYLITINAWMLMTIGDMLVAYARKGAGGLGSGDYLCYVSTTTSRNGGVVISGSRIVYMTAAEYIEFVIYQNTGVAQNLEHDDPALTCATITRLA